MLLDELDLNEEEEGDGEAEKKREARDRLRMEAEVASCSWDVCLGQQKEPVIHPVFFLERLSWTPKGADYFPCVFFPASSVLTTEGVLLPLLYSHQQSSGNSTAAAVTFIVCYGGNFSYDMLTYKADCA